MQKLLLVVGIVIVLAVSVAVSEASEAKWKITAYCSCKRCCGKSDGITASGKVSKWGYVACNWLPFGTTVVVEGMGRFTVMDRGAKSLFGDKTNHIKHLDIWFPSHQQALEFGVQWKEVKIINN